MTRRLQARHHGEPEDVLKLVEVPEDPPPGPGEVTLTVAAVGLNYLDVSLCRGEYTASSALPATPGVEAAGHVVRAGPGAEHLIGHEVLACPTFPRGALGDEVTVDAALVIDRPSGMSATVAAALPVTYQTAWFALERARVTAGDTVLIHAGAGGVGIAATQLAVARGARVLATAGSAAKRELCLAEGADQALAYDEIDALRGVIDVVMDPVGGSLLGRSLPCLSFQGRLVALGTAGGPPDRIDPRVLMAANVDLIGLSWGSTYPWRSPEAVRGAYAALARLWSSGEVRPPVHAVVGLDEAPRALADLGARRTTGKTIVTIDQEG